MLDNFLQNVEFRAVQKCANLVDLEKCCKMTIWWPKSASIQPRTSRLKLRKEGGVHAVVRDTFCNCSSARKTEPCRAQDDHELAPDGLNSSSQSVQYWTKSYHADGGTNLAGSRRRP